MGRPLAVPGLTGVLCATAVAMQVKLSVFWDYARAVGLCAMLTICLLHGGQSAAAIGANVWLSAWTGEAVVNGQQNNTSQRLGVYAALGILQGEPAEIPRRGYGGPFLISGLLGPPNHALASESLSTVAAPGTPQPTLAVYLPLALSSSS